MSAVYLVAGARTPIGRFGGALAGVSAASLGAAAVGAALARGGVDPSACDEVILGNVLSAGLGQNVARQAAVAAGVPHAAPSFTLNKVCGSGLKAVVLAGQAIALGEAHAVVAGGVEQMSGAPYLLKTARRGQRLGHGEMTDAVLCDALWDAFYDCHMGITAENIAREFGVSRADQDAFAAESQRRAALGAFADELVALPELARDEHPRPETTAASLAKLKPAFLPDGTVTAGNASGINDGAAAVLAVSRERLAELAPPWAFRLVASASVGLDPAFMGLGPAAASRRALAKAGLSVGDLDRIEVNEAFAAQAIQVNREMGWDTARVNPDGGAIALGHPVGASGARILVTLLHGLARSGGTLGLASLCIGGGQGIAVVVERVR